MESEKEYEAWGISVNHLGVRHSTDWKCECGHDLWGYKLQRLKEFIVGFSRETQLNSERNKGRCEKDQIVGGIVIQCPICSSKFWFHITLYNMNTIYE